MEVYLMEVCLMEVYDSLEGKIYRRYKVLEINAVHKTHAKQIGLVLYH